MKNHNTMQSGMPGVSLLQRRLSLTHRILVVDDDTDICRITAQTLARSNYCVDSAEDGAAAWEILQSGSYNLLITDNNMPKLTGIELVKKLRSARMALPVILATGEIPAEALAQNPSLQLAAILQKPFSVADLLETVKEILLSPTAACRQEVPVANGWGRPSINGLQF